MPKKLTKEQVKQIIQGAPTGTSPEGVVAALRAKGYQLEGYPNPQQEAKITENAQTAETKKGVLGKVGDFLGISKFGEGIGVTANRLTGGLKPIEEAQQRLQATGNQLLAKYKEARDDGDTEKAQKYMKLMQDNNQMLQDLAKGYGDIATGGLSNKEFLGSAALTAGNLLLAGAGSSGAATRGSIGAVAGQGVKSVVPAITNPIVRGAGTRAYLGSLGANVAKSAGVGAGMGLAGGLEQDQDTEGLIRSTALGLLVGGAIPPAIETLRAGAKAVGSGSRLLAQTFARTPSKAIDYAIANPKGVREGIRRAASDEKTVFKVANAANKAAGNIEAKRNTVFQKGLKKLESQLKGAPIDPTPFNERLKESLGRFDVITKSGKINPESIISDPRELKDIQTILTRMKNQSNLTPEGWWKVKRFVDNKYRPTASGEFNALITDISNGLRDEMVNNVKGFDKLLSRYEADSTLLNFLKKELGVNARARGVEIGQQGEVLAQDNTKRVINALRRAMNDNQPLANELVNELQRVGGKQIMDDLAGMYFANWLPAAGLQTFLGLGAGSALGVAAGAGALAKAAPLAAFASPRIVGQGAATVGNITQGLRNVSPEILQLLQGGGRQATYGAGVPNISK